MTDQQAITVFAEVIEPTDTLQVSYTPAVLADNLSALEAYIDKEIEPYVGAVIDPSNYEQVKDARRCMAGLNKLKEPIEQERKRIKREYEAPLKAFEGKVKSITSKIDEAREALKVQVDEADARFKDMRYSTLAEEYEGCAGVLADVIPFSAIVDDKWLNRSTNEIKAKNELFDKVQSALKGYETLQKKELNHKDKVVKHYAETLDLIGALELEDKLNEEDRKMAEFKAAQEAARLVEEQRTEPAPEPPAETLTEPTTDPLAQRFLYSLAMEFEGTRELALQVASALRELGITGATIKAIKEI